MVKRFPYRAPRDGERCEADRKPLRDGSAARCMRKGTSESIKAGKPRCKQHPPLNCWACAHSYMEPDSDLICGHPDSGPVGLAVHRGPAAHCGEDRSKFQQHPLRNPDGSLR